MLAKGGTPANAWDQVGKPGFFRKEDLFGIPRDSEFTLENFGSWLDNFTDEVNPGWADFNHDFGEALAYYDAAAIMVGGQCVRMVTKPWAQGIAQPTAVDVTHPLTGAVLDGTFWHRFMVTKRGQELIANVDYVSPAFDTNGKNEQDEAVGYKLFNIAWCSGPFLDGMKPLEMTLMSKRPRVTATGGSAAPNGAPMNPDLMKRYGIDDKADLAKCMAAMAAYAEEVDAKTAKMAADHEAEMKKFAEPEKEPDDEKAAKAEMTKTFGHTGALTFRAIATHLAAKTVPAGEVAELKAQVQTMSAALSASRDEKVNDQAIAYVTDAINAGKVLPKARDALTQTFARAAIEAHGKPNATRESIAKAGADAVAPFISDSDLRVLGRVTQSGNPIGKPAMPVTTFAADSPEDVERQINEEAKKLVAADPTKKLTMSAAHGMVLRQNDVLAAQYRSLAR